MAPGFYDTRPYKVSYDPAKDAWYDNYAFSYTHTDWYASPPKLSVESLERAKREVMLRQAQEADELKKLKFLKELNDWQYSLKPEPQKLSAGIMGRWVMEDFSTAIKPQEPADVLKEKEKQRKIYNLFWARKQKDPEFSLV